MTEILVTASETDFEEISALCARFPRTKVVLGGKTRSDSVRSALENRDGENRARARRRAPLCFRENHFGVHFQRIPIRARVSARFPRSIPSRFRKTDISAPCRLGTKYSLYRLRRGSIPKTRRAYTAAEKEGGTYTDSSSVYAAFIGAPRLCAGARENKKLTFPEDFSDNCARAGSAWILTLSEKNRISFSSRE